MQKLMTIISNIMGQTTNQTFLITAMALITWRNPTAVGSLTLSLSPDVVWPCWVTWNKCLTRSWWTKHVTICNEFRQFIHFNLFITYITNGSQLGYKSLGCKGCTTSLQL